jgi:hypothetical protein
MLGWILTFIAALAGFVAFARESLEVSAARREGRATPETFRRFRRRTLGLAVFSCLWVMLWQSPRVEATVRADEPQALLAYYLACLLLSLWMLLIAGRDLKATAEQALAESERLTMEGLEHFASALATAHEADAATRQAIAPGASLPAAGEAPAAEPPRRAKVRARGIRADNPDPPGAGPSHG